MLPLRSTNILQGKSLYIPVNFEGPIYVAELIYETPVTKKKESFLFSEGVLEALWNSLILLFRVTAQGPIVNLF